MQYSIILLSVMVACSFSQVANAVVRFQIPKINNHVSQQISHVHEKEEQETRAFKEDQRSKIKKTRCHAHAIVV